MGRRSKQTIGSTDERAHRERLKGNAMPLSIQHSTTYTFSDQVAYGLQQLRILPKSRRGQSVLTWESEIIGASRQLEFEEEKRKGGWV